MQVNDKPCWTAAVVYEVYPRSFADADGDVAVKPLDARIAKLRAERDALPNPDSDPAAQQPLEATREQWKRRWNAADHTEKRDLLKMALWGKHIVIAPAERGRGSTDEAGILRRVSSG